MSLLTWDGWKLKELRSNTSEGNVLGKNLRDWWLLSRTSDWSLSQPDLQMPGLNLLQAEHFYSINNFFLYIFHISENIWHSNPIFFLLILLYISCRVSLMALSFRRLQQHGSASSAPVSHFSSPLKGKCQNAPVEKLYCWSRYNIRAIRQAWLSLCWYVSKVPTAWSLLHLISYISYAWSEENKDGGGPDYSFLAPFELISNKCSPL